MFEQRETGSMLASARRPSRGHGTRHSLARASLVLALARCLFVLGYLGTVRTVWLVCIVAVATVIAESDLTF